MIYIGDFDADGRKDLVCRMNRGDKYCIALTGTVVPASVVEYFRYGYMLQKENIIAYSCWNGHLMPYCHHIY